MCQIPSNDHSHREQHPDQLQSEIKRVIAELPPEEFAVFLAGNTGNEAAKKVAQRLIEPVIRYCSFELMPASNSDVDPFDDPYVGAALITEDGEVLGAHRKVERQEEHAEPVALLRALLQSKGNDIYRNISNIYEHKGWLTGQRNEFEALFSDAGRLVREKNQGKKLILLSTLEPCRDYETQPGCSHIISSFCPDIIVYGSDDTNKKGQGRDILKNCGSILFYNVAIRENIRINRKFYCANHIADFIFSADVEHLRAHEIAYVIADFDEESFSYDIVNDRLAIKYARKILVHRAHQGPRMRSVSPSSRKWPELYNPDGKDRLLFWTDGDVGLLTRYLENHFQLLGFVPQAIVCTRKLEGLDNESASIDQSAVDAIKALAGGGVKIYQEAFRKKDEIFHASLSIISKNHHEWIYALFKDAQWKDGRFTSYYAIFDTPAETASILRKLQSAKRMSVFVGVQKHQLINTLISELDLTGTLSGPLAVASMEIYLVHDASESAEGAEGDVRRIVESHGFGNRFKIVRHGLSVSMTLEKLSADLVAQRLDPLVLDRQAIQASLGSLDWQVRREMGNFLAKAVEIEPGILDRWIFQMLRTRWTHNPDRGNWALACSLLNAIGDLDRQFGSKAAEELRTFAKRIAGSEPFVMDVRWRWVNAVMACAENAEQALGLLQSGEMTDRILENDFLTRELFLYAARKPFASDMLSGLLRLLQDSRREVSSKLAVRLGRVAACHSLDKAQLLALPIRPEDRRLMDEEIERCQALGCGILSSLLDLHSGAGEEAAKRLCSSLFLRTTLKSFASHVDTESVSGSAVGQYSTLRWSRQKIDFARLLLSEISGEHLHLYLSQMVEDEDETMIWTGVSLATECYANGMIEGEHFAVLLEAALKSARHYWIEREIITILGSNVALAREWGGKARKGAKLLHIIDMPSVRELFARSPADPALHPEVAAALRHAKRSLKRVLLVLPPIGPGAPRAAATTSPPLGLGILAAALLDRGHDVEIVDCHRTPSLAEGIPRRAGAFDVVGFSVVTSTLNEAKQMAAEITNVQRSSQVPLIVLGGHAATLRYRDIVNDRAFPWDYLVLGLGEKTIIDIVESHGQSERLPCRPGLISREDIVAQDAAMVATGLTALWHPPAINRQIFSIEGDTPYEPRRRDTHHEAHVILSWGCSWACSFCTEWKLAKGKETRRDVGNVAAEMERLLDNGVTRLQFIDDNLFPPIASPDPAGSQGIEWTEAFLVRLSQLRETCSQFGWRGLMRLEDFLEYERRVPLWLDKLAGSGCRLLGFGIEYGSQPRREKLKRCKLTNEDITGVMARLRRAGIMTKGFFIIGGPGENRESTLNTIEFAKSCGVDLAYFALYKNFDYSDNGRRGPLRFLQFDFDLVAEIEGATNVEEMERRMGFACVEDRYTEARRAMTDLVDRGFSFSEVFKYNDYHDNIDRMGEVFDCPNGSPRRDEFLRCVRQAYFEFYARPEFVQAYDKLKDIGLR